MNNSDNLFDAENLVPDLLSSNIDSVIGTENTLLGITKRESAFGDSSDLEELSLIEQAILLGRENQEDETNPNSFAPEINNNYSGGISRGISRSLTGSDAAENTVNPEASIAHSAENFTVAAEGRVNINGRSDFDGLPEDTTDDALIYAGLGFTINGNQTLPVKRDENGNPLVDSSNRQILVDNAVAVSDEYQSLNAGAASNKYSGLIPPQIVDEQTVEIPEYAQLLTERLNLYTDENTTEIEFNIRNNRMNNLSQWNSKFPAPGTAENPTVVRVIGGGLKIPSRVELNNYIITVEQGDINFNGSNHQLNNVTLIAENGNANLKGGTVTNSAIFAEQTINMNSGARFGGDSLIANAQGNINFNGGTVTVEETDNLKVISSGDIIFNGATGTRGQFLATNNFTFNGRSTLYGSIGAKNDITFNGRATVIGIAQPEPIIPEISIDDPTLTEGDNGTQNAQFTVGLSEASDRVVAVDYETDDITAIAGEDYSAVSGTLSFAPGETSKTIAVPVVGDSIDELDESFAVDLSNPSNGIIVKDRGQGTIIDNDLAPVLAIAEDEITETDSGTNDAVFTIRLSAASSLPISVEYSTSDGEAIAGVDYEAVSGLVEFAPGETEKTIAVPIVGDTVDEPNRAFSVNLNNASNATISTSEATGTIIDNDLPPSIGISPLEIAEGDDSTANANFTITLSDPSDLPITVDFTTVDGTAVAGTDYTARDGTVTFAPGETTATISVPILGDTVDEIDEAFAIELSNPDNATIDNEEATVTIINNDLPPSASINSISIEETDSGTVNAVFTISLDNTSGKEITLDYETVDGTARAGIDYEAKSGSLSFSPGETIQTVSIAILGDTIDEINEAFTLNLSNPSNVVVDEASGTGTIVDNDNSPELSISDLEVTESDLGSSNAVFTVNLSEASSKPISIDFSTVDGTAVAGVDYTAKSGTLTFAPGETSQTIEIPITEDNLDELTEAFSIELTNPVNVTVTDSDATVTILDNDNPPEASIDSISLTEGDGGTTNASFTVSLSQASGKPISIDYTTVDGTAIAGFDYVAASGTITFEPGETTKNY